MNAQVHRKLYQEIIFKKTNIIEQDHVGVCVAGLSLFSSHRTQTQAHPLRALPDLFAKTATGICSELSNSPQFSAPSPYLPAGQSAPRPALDVLLGCLCNLFMTAKVLLTLLFGDVNKRDKAAENIAIRWETAHSTRSVRETNNEKVM